MKNRALWLVMIGIVVGIGILVAYSWLKPKTAINQSDTTIQTTLTDFTLLELAQYDGTDSSKPIYLAMNGLVYDVTEGRKFYEKGGSYNWLAGKDSSKDLNLIGGEIIKRKYPVIGKLVQ